MQETPQIPPGSPFSLTLVSIALVSLLFATEAKSQFRNVWIPSSLEAGRNANIVLEWSGRTPVAGLLIETTTALQIESTIFTCLDGEPQTKRDYSDANRVSYSISLNEPIRGDCSIVLTVSAPAIESTDEITVIPVFAPRKNGDDSQASTPVSQEVVTLSRYTEPDNRVGRFSGRVEELLATGQRVSLDRSFTTEFWMRTSAVDQVLLSTWDGENESPYPLEVVVEPGGRLVVYSGEPGLHESMSTRRPVADGQWHHVAVSNDARRRIARLSIDGEAVDSLQYRRRGRERVGPLVLAGRQSSNSRIGKGMYRGELDEIRLWTRDRSVREIDDSRSRANVQSHNLAYTQDFENSESSPNVSRVRSSLSFDAALVPILASVEDGSVTLEWTVPSDDIVRFVVEESSDGSKFTEVGSLNRDALTPESRMSFTREGVEGGVVYYRLKQVFTDRSSRYSDTVKIGLGVHPADESFDISNYPNPFSSETTLSFEVKEESHVTLSIWDITGQSVAVLVDEVVPAGIHEAVFQAADLPSGVYFARFENGSLKYSHKITVAR